MKDKDSSKDNESPNTSPVLRDVMFDKMKKIVFGGNGVVNNAANFAGIAAATALYLPVTSPALNILNMMHKMSQNDLRVKYPVVIKEIYQKSGGIGGFYEQTGKNFKRRTLGLGTAFALSEYLGKEFDLSNEAKFTISATTEALISWKFGEINERRKTARVPDNIPPNLIGAASFLLTRNLLFGASVYSKEILDGFMKHAGKDLAHEIGADEESVKAVANWSIKALLVSSTMPFDKGATLFAIGRNPFEEFYKNPALAFKGTFARMTYALIVGHTVNKGVEWGEEIAKKLNLGSDSKER